MGWTSITTTVGTVKAFGSWTESGEDSDGQCPKRRILWIFRIWPETNIEPKLEWILRFHDPEEESSHDSESKIRELIQKAGAKPAQDLIKQINAVTGWMGELLPGWEL